MGEKDVNSFFSAQRTCFFHPSSDFKKKKKVVKRKLAQKQDIKTDKNNSISNEASPH